jgi:NADH/NAD ratio-sensing transcriptional regulator Rex
MVGGGVGGIVTFCPVVLNVDSSVVVRNIRIIEAFRFLTALISLSSDGGGGDQEHER